MSDTLKPVSAKAARAVLKIVREHFRAWTHTPDGKPLEHTPPVLHEPGTGWGDHWVISWEGEGPHPWPVLLTGGGVDDYSGARVEPATLPRGVFCEPINGCELGIYPPHQW